ncbi:MAG: hypothetical protein AAFV29_26560, partial [Myxococcota bacterium]
MIVLTSGCFTLPPAGLETGRVLGEGQTSTLAGVGFGFGRFRQAPGFTEHGEEKAEAAKDGGAWTYHFEPMLFLRHRRGLGGGTEVDVTGTLLIAGLPFGIGGYAGVKQAFVDQDQVSAAVGARAGADLMVLPIGRNGGFLLRLLASPRIATAVHPSNDIAVHAVPYGMFEYLLGYSDKKEKIVGD